MSNEIKGGPAGQGSDSEAAHASGAEVTALIREWGTRCAALEEQNYALREALRTTILNLRTLRDAKPGIRTYDKWLEVTEAVLAKAEGRSDPKGPSAIPSPAPPETP